MSIQELVPLLATIGPVLVAVISALVDAVALRDKARRRMQADAELLQHLPQGSQASKVVLKLVMENAEELLKQHGYKRDWPSLVMALAGVIGLGYLGIWLWSLQVWYGWLILALVAVLWLVLLFGVVESAQKKDREGEE